MDVNPRDPSLPSEQSAPPALLEIHNVSKLSLKGISLCQRRGERVAILGESGSGKSVLLSLILGILKPDSGIIILNGSTISSGQRNYHGLGVAFQQPGLLDALTAGENLGIGLDDNTVADHISDILKSLNLDTISKDSLVSRLSGGQQKRLAIARAVLHASELLILDEPTSGLDSRSAEQASVFIKKHLANKPLSLLLITHDYRLALELCTRVLLISGGSLKDVTPPQNLVGAGAVQYLQEQLSESSRAVPGGARFSSAPGWSYFRSVWQFTWAGLVLAVPIMALLGSMLVVQSRGVSPIDISRFVPGAVTVAILRELAPLVVGLLLVSRIGGKIAAEISGMSYTAQIDSMKVMQLSPMKLLLRPFGLAAITAYPICIIAGAAAAIYAGAYCAEFSWSGLHIGTNRFLGLVFESLGPGLLLSCFTKAILMGCCVAFVSYAITARQISNAPALGSAVTRASVYSAVVVVLIDVIISWMFFSGGRT